MIPLTKRSFFFFFFFFFEKGGACAVMTACYRGRSQASGLSCNFSPPMLFFLQSVNEQTDDVAWLDYNYLYCVYLKMPKAKHVELIFNCLARVKGRSWPFPLVPVPNIHFAFCL